MLISEDYRKQQEHLHATTQYGTASIGYAPLVSQIMNTLGVLHLLDYGCSSLCNLIKHLKVDHEFTYQAYDPCVERFSSAPVPAEMVACIDVLEHIEPDCLDDVLNDLERLTEVVGVFTVHTGPAVKVLPDGRNAHLIQRPMEWWLPKIWERFDLQNFARTENGFHVVVYARGAGTLQG
jgi:hypothetical protein